MVRKVEKYVTEDGTEFWDEVCAEYYESQGVKIHKLFEALDTFLYTTDARKAAEYLVNNRIVEVL